MNLSGLRSRLVLVALSGLIFAPCAAGTVGPGDATPKPDTPTQAVHDQMRMIYEDQIVWTRMLELGVFNDLKGKEAYTARCSANYEAFEHALAPYYREGAVKLAELLEVHIVLTEKVFWGLKDGYVFEAPMKYWYANASDIADLMTSLNPKQWPEDESRLYWRMYLDLTLERAIAHMKGNWDADVAAYDALHLHALKMADFMSNGMGGPKPTTTSNPK